MLADDRTHHIVLELVFGPGTLQMSVGLSCVVGHLHQLVKYRKTAFLSVERQLPGMCEPARKMVLVRQRLKRPRKPDNVARNGLHLSLGQTAFGLHRGSHAV